jgi:hypothetical protein
LVFPLEVLLEDDAVNLRALFTEPLLRVEVGAIQGGVARQFTGSADACVERLVTGIASVPPVRVQQMASTRRQGDRPLASIE